LAGKSCVLVACGPAALRQHLHPLALAANLPLPERFSHYIDLSKEFELRFGGRARASSCSSAGSGGAPSAAAAAAAAAVHAPLGYSRPAGQLQQQQQQPADCCYCCNFYAQQAPFGPTSLGQQLCDFYQLAPLVQPSQQARAQARQQQQQQQQVSPNRAWRAEAAEWRLAASARRVADMLKCK